MSTTSHDYAVSMRSLAYDLCIYITAINLLHLKGFPQFNLPEIKANVHLFPYSSTTRFYLNGSSLMEYIPSD